ncbi:hypothetical protein MAH1_06450 [Sessilibacter sp. MAH1]
MNFISGINMDILPVAEIVETLRAAIACGATELTESTVKSAFTAVKTKISDLFGINSKPSKALEDLAENPESHAYKAVLVEEFDKHNVADLVPVQTLINGLISALQQTQSGKEQLAKFLNQDETNIGVQGDNNTVTTSGDFVVKKS